MISRHDLIAAGGCFFVSSFEHNPQAEPQVGSGMDGHQLYVMVTKPNRCEAYVSSVSTMGNNRCTLGQDLDSGQAPASTGIVERREHMARFFDLADPEAASALRQLQDAPQGALAPWEAPGNVPRLAPDQIEQSGLNLDALLFVSTRLDDRDGVRHYLGLGADPLHAVEDGDCAARVGVSLGMPEFNNPAWVNAKDHQTGETGLHQLAARDKLPELRAAIEVGGRMEEPDNRGLTVWKHFRPTSQEKMERELMPLAMDAHAQGSRAGLNEALAAKNEQDEPVARIKRRM